MEYSKVITYPVAELFHSLQGEGVHVGRPYFFIRLAACNVGRYELPTTILPATNTELSAMILSNPKHSVCTTFDGQKFLCDTDYHSQIRMTAEQIAMEKSGELTCCITGGEPFLHDLSTLAAALMSRDVEVIAIETSGTLPLPKNLDVPAEMLWITCCPKSVDGKSFADGSGIDVQDVDEWKILVGPDFKESTLRQFESLIPSTCENKFLQPINGVYDIWSENVKRCLKLLESWPNWRLSSQLHKYLNIS